MKISSIILSLFLLCSCTDSAVESFATAGVGSLLRPAQNYPLGSDAALSYSFNPSSFEDPVASWWDFEPDDADDDYLGSANIDALEETSYTIVAMIRSEDVTDNCDIAHLYTNGTNRVWRLYSTGTNPSIGSGRNSCVNMWFKAGGAVGGWANAEDVLIAGTFAYSGNAGAGDSDITVWLRESGGMSSATDAVAEGPVLDCTSLFRIGTLNGFEATNSFDGRMYWLAYYSAALNQATLEGLYDGTIHPREVGGLVLYIDFREAVAATYTTEVGGFVLDVFGTPVKGP